MGMENRQHEDKTHQCRFIGCKETTQAPRHARTIGATWTCLVHRRLLTLTPTERAQADVLKRLIEQGQVALGDAGWLITLPPKSPPQGCPIVMDDGSPRYCDRNRSAVIGGSDVGE
jgi:hypothetical protein